MEYHSKEIARVFNHFALLVKVGNGYIWQIKRKGKRKELQIATKEALVLKIANSYKKSYPCVKEALLTPDPITAIRKTQNRLLTYKELLLHRHMLDANEIKKAFNHLNHLEQEAAKLGLVYLTDVINEIDSIIKFYSRELTP